MKTTLLPLLVLTASVCAVCTGCSGSGEGERAVQGAEKSTLHDDDEVPIPLDQVPQVVKDAALAAVPGLVLTEAEEEMEDGVLVYDLEGTVDGKPFEVEVTPEGEVLEAGPDDDDEDEGHDDDGDEGHDGDDGR